MDREACQPESLLQAQLNQADMIDASFKHLLKTNDIPSESDLPKVWKEIEEQSKELVETEDEIFLLKLRLLSLEIERNTRKDRLQAYKSIVCKARRVPGDIWINIFQLVFQDSGQTALARRTLMATCRQWRALIEGSAIFWTTIHLRGSSWERTELFAHVGTSTPLLISLSLPSSSASWSLNWLLEYIPRVHQLHIRQWCPMQLWSIPFPNLECISYTDIVGDGISIYKAGNQNSRLTAPSLREATVQCASSPFGLPIPWDQLTMIEIKVTSWIDWTNFLTGYRSCSHHLEHFTLEAQMSHPVSIMNLTEAPITNFPKLKFLHLNLADSREMAILLDCTIAPRLEHVVLAQAKATVWYQNLKDLVERSSSQLKSIHHSLHVSLPGIRTRGEGHLGLTLGETSQVITSMLSHSPGISTMRIDTKHGYYVKAVVESLTDSPEFTRRFQTMRVVYQRPETEDRRILSGKKKGARHLSPALHEPAIVLASADRDIPPPELRGSYRDFQNSANTIFSSPNIHRVDIYLEYFCQMTLTLQT